MKYPEFQEPEAILEKRVTRQGVRYLVHWKNAPEHDNSWENVDEMMLRFPSIVESFEALQRWIVLVLHCSEMFAMLHFSTSFKKRLILEMPRVKFSPRQIRSSVHANGVIPLQAGLNRDRLHLVQGNCAICCRRSCSQRS